MTEPMRYGFDKASLDSLIEAAKRGAVAEEQVRLSQKFRDAGMLDAALMVLMD